MPAAGDEPDDGGGARRGPGSPSAPADHRDVAGDPLVVRDALPAAAAVRDRRPPEADPVEVSGAVPVAAVLAEQSVSLAGGRHGRNRAEPGGEVPLRGGRDRVLQPPVGAV